MTKLYYHLFKLESSNFERDYLLIGKMFSEYPNIRLEGVEKYRKNNYDPGAGEFAVPTVMHYSMFPLQVASTNSGVLGIAILSEYLQALVQIDVPPTESKEFNDQFRRATDGVPIDRSIAWLTSKVKSCGSSANVFSCERIGEADLDSQLPTSSAGKGQL